MEEIRELLFQRCLKELTQSSVLNDVLTKTDDYKSYLKNCSKNKTKTTWIWYRSMVTNKPCKTKVYMIEFQNEKRMFVKKNGYGDFAEIKETDNDLLHGYGFYPMA